ncbi:hypothetical protein GCM10010873_07810 [Cypionkella aquatica]|uniref:DUF1203 domain-containing protein n=1 Tax=Cypionkella aquatica TaxID=1756042 RepID=A0AA37TQH0_9RHOB|nr:DUF1203 domain-containing protein [Cypionkella aquatica]GLS85807.1 hypothetical protein GCM10010873_07810 [Cypionkella aquatica]
MIRFTAIPTETARAYQAGSPDANGQAPERHIATGAGNPCRHCLKMIAEGAEMLILAHRPFPEPQPYAEIGPIFLCADACAAGGGTETPAILASPNFIIRGYSAENRIVYGTGAVVPTNSIAAEAAARLNDPRIAYVHIRSARNNCYQLRIDRA